MQISQKLRIKSSFYILYQKRYGFLNHTNILREVTKATSLNQYLIKKLVIQFEFILVTIIKLRIIQP